MALTELGLSAAEEAVYRTLLASPDADLDEIARRSHVVDVDAALAHLGELRLIVADAAQPSGHRLRRPGVALSDLADARVTSLVEDLRRLADVRADILGLDEVAGQYRLALSEKRSGDHVEVLADAAQAQARLDDLAYLARVSLDNVFPLNARRTPRASVADLQRSVRRGVVIRTLLDDIELASPEWTQNLARQVSIGAQLRTADRAVDRLVLVDREIAVVPLKPHDTAAGALLVHAPVLVAALSDLFDRMWHGARTMRVDAGRLIAEPPRVTRTDVAILRAVLNADHDETAAAELHLSTRHVRRRVALVMTSLGARNRLHLGVLAERYGLLTD